jgi:hypothetical protein
MDKHEELKISIIYPNNLTCREHFGESEASWGF